MHKFTLAGREWTWPKMTTRTINHVRDTHGLDLRALIREDAALATALADDEKLLAVFCDLCGRQFAESGLTREQLEEGMDFEGLTAMRGGLIEAFFTLSLGLKKGREMAANARESLS